MKYLNSRTLQIIFKTFVMFLSILCDFCKVFVIKTRKEVDQYNNLIFVLDKNTKSTHRHVKNSRKTRYAIKNISQHPMTHL